MFRSRQMSPAIGAASRFAFVGAAPLASFYSHRPLSLCPTGHVVYRVAEHCFLEPAASVVHRRRRRGSGIRAPARSRAMPPLMREIINVPA